MKSLVCKMILALLASSTAVASPLAPVSKTCILNFERINNPITKGIRRSFQNDPQAVLTLEAVPADLVRSIQNGCEEILMVAHAFEISDQQTLDGRPLVKLGFFIRDNSSITEPHYHPGFFLDHIFEVASEALSQQERAHTKTLQRIRFMACDPQDIFAAYPTFEKMVEDHQIQLDVAPTSPFLSLFHKIPVTRVDIGWLAKSVDCYSLKEWRTPENHYCTTDAWKGCDRATAEYCLPLRAK